MIRYEYNGMYEFFVYQGNYKAGSILSFEGRRWWYKPYCGMPKVENFDSLEEVKTFVEQLLENEA